MPPRVEDWSDSDDDDAVSEIETSVLLGIPDGAMEEEGDGVDAAVSRIGGLPALLPTPEPAFESSFCANCVCPMPLLVQMWCPFEDSPYDRALYVWACPRGGCQRQEGSVRAWRGLRYNAKYAEKLQRKQAAAAAKKAKREESQKAASATQKTTSNPFSMNGSATSTANPFSMGAGFAPGTTGFGDNIFGAEEAIPEPEDSANEEADVDVEAEEPPASDDESGSASTSSSAESLVVALTSTSISESPWKSAPRYPAQYLSTAPEYLPPSTLKKQADAKKLGEALEDDAREGGNAWTAEKYENSMETDPVFDRFNGRVAAEPEQCVRYDLGGTPLLFSSDKTFEKLFPLPGKDFKVTIIGNADMKAGSAHKREYDSSRVGECPKCHSKRVFECQLMPNLINVLKEKEGGQTEKGLTDEERRKLVESELKGGAKEGRGMEWGAVLVFCCEKDCCVESEKGRKDGWFEEVVMVQWDE